MDSFGIRGAIDHDNYLSSGWSSSYPSIFSSLTKARCWRSGRLTHPARPDNISSLPDLRQTTRQQSNRPTPEIANPNMTVWTCLQLSSWSIRIHKAHAMPLGHTTHKHQPPKTDESQIFLNNPRPIGRNSLMNEYGPIQAGIHDG